jgi:membrane-associated phospholipid phosphatase
MQRTVSTIALLDAPAGGPAARVAERLRGHAPLVAYVVSLLLGFVAVAAVTVGLGFLLVDVLVPIHAIGHSDEAVNIWLAAHRDGTLNRASAIGSSIGDVPVLPVLVTLIVLAAAVRRRWRVAGFVLGSVLVELGTYRVASLIVHRHRPYVVRLDHLPVEQSFPSGHVAASVAVYGSLALLISATRVDRRLVAAAWTLAVLLPLVVACSRMYRGMHHPLDVASGAIVGVLAISAGLLATRAADAVAARRAQGL